MRHCLGALLAGLTLACGGDGSNSEATAFEPMAGIGSGGCREDADCNSHQFCDGRYCRAYGGEGSHCEGDHWCASPGLVCREPMQRCSQPSGLNEACARDAECVEGLSCGEHSVCIDAEAAMPVELDLPFAPSNIATLLSGRTLGPDSDIVIDGDQCSPCACGQRVAIADLGVGCYLPSGAMTRALEIEVVMHDQSGVGDRHQTAVVVFLRNLVLGPGASVDFNFPGRPLVIVAQGRIELRPDESRLWVADGGYPGGRGSTSGVPGEGPGGGGFGTSSYPSGEGGAYCTLGGLGDGQDMPRGMIYGDETIVPLLPGSGGGMPHNNFSTQGGDGGGALALVAGESITIGANMRLSVEGRSGDRQILHGPGGGSGGALLLEAPSVRVDGELLAGGGAGGGDERDGGSGGLGRIRINTEPDGSELAPSALTPDLASGCATIGELQAR